MTRRIVFAGGPGAGKSTVLDLLAAAGYPVADDAARAIIRERQAAGRSLRPDPAEFAGQILKRDLDAYAAAQEPVTFFERGIVDAVGMLFGSKALDQGGAQALIKRHPYDNPVFLFPPWQAIYGQDAQRDHSFEHAQSVYRQTSAWYARNRYELVDVPLDTPAVRFRFVLETLHLSEQPAADQ